MSTCTSWRLLVVVLLAITLGVAACGGTSTPSISETTESTTPTEGPVESTPSDTTTQSDVTTPAEGSGGTAGSEQAADGEQPGGTPPAVTESPSTSLDAQAAVDVALAAVPGGAVIEIERDRHYGHPTWEVLVRDAGGSGIELDIDATTGDVLRREPEELPSYARASAPAIDVRTAMASALAVTPGVVDEVELERWKDGRVVWEVEIVGADGRHTEIYIDATTGEVIR